MPCILVLRRRLHGARHLRGRRLLVSSVESNGDDQRMRRWLLRYISCRVDCNDEPVLWSVHMCGRRLLPCCFNDCGRNSMPRRKLLPRYKHSARVVHCRSRFILPNGHGDVCRQRMPGIFIMHGGLCVACHLRDCRLLVSCWKPNCDDERMRRGLLRHICCRVDCNDEPVFWSVHGRSRRVLPCCVNDCGRNCMPRRQLLPRHKHSARAVHCRSRFILPSEHYVVRRQRMSGIFILRWRHRGACHLRHCGLLVSRVESNGDDERMRRGLLRHSCCRVDGDYEPVLWSVHGRSC